MSARKLTGKGEKVREKMIATTVHILQQQGFKKATVRTIAREANVNIASVRYYFGSKEELIGCALEYMMGNLENIVSYLDDTRLPARERMKNTSSPISIWPASTLPCSVPFPIPPAKTPRTPTSFTFPSSTASAGRRSSAMWRKLQAIPMKRTWS